LVPFPDCRADARSFLKAETVIVQVKDGKSFPLTEEARAELARWGMA
jgi:hypothetical protein